MYQVTRVIHFCYGHRLMNYPGKCRHLHGHNGQVEIELSQETLDRRGMVVDFDDIKRTIQTWIDEELDHKMLLRHDDPALATLQQLGEPLHVMQDNPTAEHIAKLIFDYARSRQLPATAVRLWETRHSFASYHPTLS